mmetsp:Transcript_62226/g.116461  ORF Transcript_62226/g.116461 Transcript_62226/m.116461 type:complete len:219 (-) Transcript_62226:36-692(-)
MSSRRDAPLSPRHQEGSISLSEFRESRKSTPRLTESSRKSRTGSHSRRATLSPRSLSRAQLPNQRRRCEAPVDEEELKPAWWRAKEMQARCVSSKISEADTSSSRRPGGSFLSSMESNPASQHTGSTFVTRKTSTRDRGAVFLDENIQERLEDMLEAVADDPASLEVMVEERRKRLDEMREKDEVLTNQLSGEQPSYDPYLSPWLCRVRRSVRDRVEL